MSWFSRLFKPFEWPKDLPPAKELLNQLYHKDALQASVMITKSGPIDNEIISILGNVLLGLENEKWPKFQGKKMVGVAQINLEESTVIPECLNDLKFITVFIANGNDQCPVDLYENDDNESKKFIIRSYKSLDKLVPYKDAPEPLKDITPQKVVMHRTFYDPYPYWDTYLSDYKKKYGEKVYRLLKQTLKDDFNQSSEKYKNKIGGYPAPINNSDDRPLAFQLECDDVGLGWGIGGYVFIWRNPPGTDPEWEYEIEIDQDY